MKIKLNELHKADWRYINTPEINLYNGKCIIYRESKKYGYRFNIILLNDKYYLTQSLYTINDNMEHISVHETKSINDAKAILEVMLQFIKNYRRKDPVTKQNLSINYDA